MFNALLVDDEILLKSLTLGNSYLACNNEQFITGFRYPPLEIEQMKEEFLSMVEIQEWLLYNLFNSCLGIARESICLSRPSNLTFS
jgi:hypothetical protein